MTPTYVLSSSAEADLRDIVRHTRKQWGAPQARIYVAQVREGIEMLVAGQGAFKDMSDLYPALRMARCEHHYIFCLPRTEEPAIIIAIFHERMDLMTRLGARLS
ncbi:type II toxin-antitoxin system RelE/ParE family toxin [Sphingobium sp. CR28]|uniref:type II toxin-antitoxin system RelE/ParE family toxin n=1 Tax=Sphingobium sp. CR28 TaxID=3400272 RepID=UPI003FEE70AD